MLLSRTFILALFSSFFIKELREFTQLFRDSLTWGATMPFVAAPKKGRDFDPKNFLATIGEGRKAVLFPKKRTIFTQGDSADAIFYLQTGKVRLTVVSKTGKEATIGILSDGSFFGEGSLAGQPLRMGTATAMTDCAV